jgi:hypothetical protein
MEPKALTRAAMVVNALLKICEGRVYIDSNFRGKLRQHVAKSPLEFGVKLINDIVDFHFGHVKFLRTYREV